MRLTALGDFSRALEVVKRTNPLPYVCGTICAHHCEDECRRNDVDKPLSIRGIKRAVVEYGSADYPTPAPADPAKKVAIIGSGPAGLTAAFDLTMAGCEVTVFEREERLGGTPVNFIPLYRLPDETVLRDIKALEKLGIRFRAGVEFGTDFSLDDLKKEGFKAVVVAVGLTASRGLPIPGADHPDVLRALPFLRATKREGFRLDSRHVVVIGGGNVAMDVARSAVRCGASEVHVVCLESAKEMPAFPWEIEEGREEGIEYHCSWGPKAIRIEDGRITGLEVKECTSVFDEARRFAPKYNEDNVSFVPGDTVIFAIGQGLDLGAVGKAGVILDERGRLMVDPATLKTPQEGVFACGEAVIGPTTAVKAMAHGRLVAQAVLAYLEGRPFVASMLAEEEPLPDLAPEVAEKVVRIERLEIPMLKPEERRENFLPIEHGYTELMALCESKRCLGCAAGALQRVEDCADCLTCLRACPYGVPVVGPEGNVLIRGEQCQACGLCLTVCPNLAVEFRATYIREAEQALEEALDKLVASKNDKPLVLAICCGYGAYATEEFVDGYLRIKPSNVGVVRFPCISKVDVLHILRAFEVGVDGVVVAGCAEDEKNVCPFQKAALWAQRKVNLANALLNELGLGEGRVRLLTLDMDQVTRFGAHVEEAMAGMNLS